jgi:protein gp37
MSENTAIEWTDATVNFWWGCTKVGPGCDHCYAETWDKRTGGAHWGPHAPRRWIKGASEALRRINRTALAFLKKHGRQPRVFMHSMSDIFDNAVPPEWQTEALSAVVLAHNVQVQLVTKRIGNVEEAWARVGWPWPENAGLMITVCNQTEADRDIPRLLALKARLGIPWVGLSVEPMLGPVDLSPWHGVHHHPANRTDDPETLAAINAVISAARTQFRAEHGNTGLDWVICGGESGPHARPMHPDWARSLRDQCAAAGVPFFFKQWGEWGPSTPEEAAGNPRSGWRCLAAHPHVAKAAELYPEAGAAFIEHKGKKAAGRLLDGREWNQFPGVAND